MQKGWLSLTDRVAPIRRNTHAKLDIRDWSPEHDKMSRGITLNADEVQRLIDSVHSRDAIAMLRDLARPPRTSYER